MDSIVSRRRPQEGFTLLEALVVLAVMGIIVAIGLPAFMNTIRKEKIHGTVRETASMMRAARLQAVKESAAIGVEEIAGERRIVMFRETAAAPYDGYTAGTDEIVNEVRLPNRVDFSAPSGESVIDGFDGQTWMIFEPDGAVNESGAFRIGDERGNYLEVRVDPPATGRVDILKWGDPDGDGTSKFMSQGQQGHSWRWN